MIQSYPWYIADWRESETRISLSLAERGLYRELLDYCYLEGSLPKDQTRLSRLAGCSPKEFAQSWGSVSKLFDEDGDRLTHRKVNEVKAKVLKYHEQKKHAGAASGRSRRERSLNVRSFVAQTRVEPAPAPAPSPTPSHETQTLFAAEAAESEIPKHPESVVRPDVPTKAWWDEQHDRWYQGYWNKQGKQDSRRAFEKAVIHLRDGYESREDVVWWLAKQRDDYRKRFEDSDQWEFKIKLHPATWLNGKRWEDQAPPANGSHAAPPQSIYKKVQ